MPEATTMKAVWHDTVIAESDQTIVLEGNHYFPPQSVNYSCLGSSTTESFCHWKGKASYYHIDVDGQRNSDAAWYYADPQPAAHKIANYVAFWKGVRIES